MIILFPCKGYYLTNFGKEVLSAEDLGIWKGYGYGEGEGEGEGERGSVMLGRVLSHGGYEQ